MNLLVTGGGSDIGQAIVARRLALGDRVTITASSHDSLASAMAACDERERAVDGLVLDLRTPEASSADVDRVLARGIDAVVLNAWTRRPPVRRLHEMTPRSVEADLRANVLGNCWLIQRALPGMLERGFGRIVLISSVSAVNGTSRYSTYVMGKAAMEGLMRNLAVDYGEHNILANTVRLGLFKTARTRRFWSAREYAERMSAVIPQGALGEPAAIGPVLDPLLCAEQYINGAVIDVSGGLPMFRLHGVLQR